MTRCLRILVLIVLFYVASEGVSGTRQPFAEVELDVIGDVYPAIPANPHVSSLSHENFGSLLRFIKVNGYYITFSDGAEAWHASPMIAHMLRKPVKTLLVEVQFKKHGIDFRIPRSANGRMSIRPSNSSIDVFAADLNMPTSTTMATSVDLYDAVEQVRTFAYGPLSVQIQLVSPHVKEALVITMGEIDARKIRARTHSAIGLQDFWGGTAWQKFVDRCDLIPSYEDMLENRLWWAEGLITIFSVGYCAAVNWLGPLDFTPWQQRCYQTACVSSAFFQVIFGLSVAKSISVRIAIPFALAFGLVYLVSFNLTNVLILCEYSQHDGDDGDDSLRSEGPFAFMRRRPDPGRTFNSIPSSRQLHGMTRVVMVGYKKARFG